MFKGKKTEPAVSVPRYTTAIRSHDRSVSLSVSSESLRTDYYTGGKVPAHMFEGAIAVAVEFRDALTKAIEDAQRLDGALASVFPAK